MSRGNNTVIVTGGAGYIGSHIVVKLYEAGLTPVIVDNFFNSSPTVIGKLEVLIGNSIEFALLDMRDEAGLASLLSRK